MPAHAQSSVPAVNWTGAYVGGNFGYSWGHGEDSYFEPGFCCGIPTSFYSNEQLNGAIGGGQIGWNYQINPVLVVGVETDFQWTGEKGQQNSGLINFNDCEGVCTSGVVHSQNDRINWFGTARGRIGPAFEGPVLGESTWLYLTGGLAYGRVSVSGMVTDTGCGPPCVLNYGASATKVGYAGGAGMETRFGNSNWSWKVEYIYINLGTISGSGSDPDFVSPYFWSARITDNIFRVGVNWKTP